MPFIDTYIHTTHALSQRGSRGISDIPTRRPRSTKAADVIGGKPIRRLIAIYLKCNALHPLVTFYDTNGRERGRGAILLF
jgi:hypothetical protein